MPPSTLDRLPSITVLVYCFKFLGNFTLFKEVSSTQVKLDLTVSMFDALVVTWARMVVKNTSCITMAVSVC